LARVFALSLVLLELASATRPKHVVMVVIDDLGFDDMGFANSQQVATPTFDAMHAAGVSFSNYYVQPSCSPTRATLLTGRKPVHTGINYWIPNAAYGLPLNETTLAQVMNARGFRSHAVGKWHLGLHKSSYLPTFRGFDSFYGFYEGSEDYWSHNFYGQGLDFHEENSQNCSIKSGCSKLLWDQVGHGSCDRHGRCSEPDYWAKYSTHLFTTRAETLIAEHAKEHSKAGLFLYLAYQGVHEPRQAPAHYVDRNAQTIDDDGRRAFAGMLSAVDEGIANVSHALQSAGMYNDTLFIVTTDNGGPTTECSTTGQSNFPFRGSKCSIWEGGTRGMAFMFWAGLPALAKGLLYPGLIHACDWLPTIVTAVASEMPLALGDTLPLDGIDVWGALQVNGTSPRTWVYYGISQSGKGPAVRDVNGWKLIVSDSGGGKGEWSVEQLPNKSLIPLPWTEPILQITKAAGDAPSMLLYNVHNDPGERADLPVTNDRYAAKVAALQKILASVELTRVPQARADPSCPSFSGLNTTENPPRLYIGPWCDDP